MDNNELELCVKQLKKKGNTAVYNALIMIRTKFIKEENGIARFRQFGGVQLLLYHIQKPNYKIVELTLSILGNCCLEQETRNIIRRSGGIPHIVKILESLDKESILNRACRTLANLALDDQNADEILKGNATKLIISLLSSAKDSHFKQSALRTLRILATTPPHREKVNEFGGTDCLCKLLIAKNDDPDVLYCILRGLAMLTVSCSPDCARQMQNVAYLEKLVLCATDTSGLHEETSLHVIANLSRQETLRPVLGSAGIVPVLVKRVAKWEKASSGWQWAVDALCQCTREAVNRIRVREEGGLKHFVSLLEDKEDERLWLCSLSSVVNFGYDETSFAVLVDLGLVSALVDRFNMLVLNEARVEHNDGSSEAPTSDICRSNGKESETCHPAFFYDGSEQKAPVMGMVSQAASPHTCCFSPDCSPPYWTSFPSVSNLQMSPGTVSPRLSFSPVQSHPLDGFCYSPVYDWSDTDDENNSVGDSMSSKDTISSRELDSPSVSLLQKNEDDDLKDGYDSDKELFKTNTVGRSPLGDILVLFSRLSWQENPCQTFIKNGIFAALIDYVVEVEHPQSRAKRCLSRIVRNPLCFENLVLQRIPSRLQKELMETQHVPAQCAACSTMAALGQSLMTDLRLQAESAFGCGIILHLLLGKSDLGQKVSAAAAASYLLRSLDVRRKIFLDSTGLTILTNALEPKNRSEHFDEAVNGLFHLARSLFTSQPSKETELLGEDRDGGCSYDRKLKFSQETVHLCVEEEEDGSIAVDRNVLSAECDVFYAMLCGGFSESRQERVLIRDASYKAVEYVVHYLHSCRPCLCPTLVFASSSVNLLLEVLALADKFLLPQLKDIVAQKIMERRPPLNDSEYAQTLSSSKLHNCRQLLLWVHSQLFMTVYDNPKDMNRRFNELLAIDEQFLKDCQSFLTDSLSLQTQTVK